MDTEELNLRDKRIENYLHTRMSANELEAFESEMKADENLKKEVEDLSELISLYDEGLFELRKRLQSTESDLKGENFFKDKGSDSQVD